MSEVLSERHAQAVWYDRDLRPTHLVTRDGQTVRVVSPGTWNFGAGPDFKDAVLEVGLDRRRLRGDVEVHLSPLDWEAHGHGNDPAYRYVIAHVTWCAGPAPASLPSAAISICLGRFVIEDVGFSPEQIDLKSYPFDRMPMGARPCQQCIGDKPERVAALLVEAGARRLQGKAERLRRLGLGAVPSAGDAAAFAGWRRRQLFYEEVMTALGYSRNTRGFRAVAAAVPLSAVEAEPENAERAFLTAATFVDWNRAGLRPFNAPEARLAAAAHLFTEADVLSLADVTDFSAAGCGKMIKLLTAGRVVGRGRAAAILANVVVPFALAEGRLAAIPAWLPPEDVSEPVRLTAFRLFGRDLNPATAYTSNGLKIQGLIQIHRAFCLGTHPDCENCRLVADVSARQNELMLPD